MVSYIIFVLLATFCFTTGYVWGVAMRVSEALALKEQLTNKEQAYEVFLAFLSAFMITFILGVGAFYLV